MNVSDGSIYRDLVLKSEEWILNVVFSPDGKNIISGGYRNIYIWNIKDSSLIRSISAHEYLISSLALSLDGSKLFSGGIDGTLKIWNTNDGNLVRELSGHKDCVNSLSLSPDGIKFASGSDDYTIKVWDTDKGDKLLDFSGHTTKVRSICLSNDGSILFSGGNDGTIKSWNLSDNSLINTLKGHTKSINSIDISPDGSKLASIGYDSTLRIWNTNDGNIVRTINVGSSGTVRYSPDGKILASGGFLKLWNTTDWTLIRKIDENNPTSSMAFLPDGTKIAALYGYFHKVVLWNVNDGSVFSTLSEFPGSSICISPDGTIFASGIHDGYKGTVKIWNLNNGNVIRTLGDFIGAPTSFTFSSDGRYLAVGCTDNAIRIWNVSDGKLLKTINFDHGYPLSTCYSKDGKKLYSGGWGYNNLRIYDATITGIDETPEQKIKNFVLNQNYPNPFNPVTNISYQLPRSSFVSLKIYDMFGGEVSVPVSEKQSAGYHTLRCEAKNIPTGVYFYKLQTEDNLLVRKMMYHK